MFKTMALPITENTYPVAVACLPAGFLLIPKHQVVGNYLVINEIRVKGSSNGDTKAIHLSNTQYVRGEFLTTYEFVGSEPKRGQFGEVRLISTELFEE